MGHRFADATEAEVNEAAERSWQAFEVYRTKNLKQRAGFLRAIAIEIQNSTESLIDAARQETNLDESRLKVELNRTVFQLNSYADACEHGNWLDIRIDTSDLQRNPPKPDLRKMQIPLGPVAVFGASNFPFAYSTAGGDTACALAAGCPVIVKAHPAHAQTSELAAAAVTRAAVTCGLPASVFIHLHGSSFETGKALVLHHRIKAVGFTGSFAGGKALFDLAGSRPEPIPVFAEMGSVNPVFILPGKLKTDAAAVASMYSKSITLSAGQFCTNPGILVAVEDDGLEKFKTALSREMEQALPSVMLHTGIAKNFHSSRKKMLAQTGIANLTETEILMEEEKGLPTLAQTSASAFLKNKELQEEVFGPFSLLVICRDRSEMLEVAGALKGQLTATLMASEDELGENLPLIDSLKNVCGRLIFNGVPTGVEVALSMHHGGPFPATTDSRFTSVGADGIKRFCRPLCFQNCPETLLPDELKNANPLGLWRTVNNRLTRDAS